MSPSTPITVALLVCLGLFSMALAQDRTYSTQNKATINKEEKTIDAQFGGHGDAKADSANLAVLQNRVNLLLKQHKEALSAQAAGDNARASLNRETVQANKVKEGQYQAENAKGETAKAVAANDRYLVQQGAENARAALAKEGDVLKGGNAQQGTHDTQMQLQQVDGRNTSRMVADKVYKADATAITEDRFGANLNDDKNNKGMFNLEKNALSQTAGDGKIAAKTSNGSANYDWNMQQDGVGKGDVSLQQTGNADGAFSRHTTGWKCAAVKDGESVCRDSNGKIVGKVLTNSKGEASVVDANGVVVGRGQVQKLSNEQYKVIVSDGLAIAEVTALKEYDCYSEIVKGGAQEHKIVIENVVAKIDGELVGDATTYSWPTCFDIEADVTIPKGVDPARLAFEYVGHVMPLGSLKCMDSMTCGRGCYYCNMCEKEKMLDDFKQRLTPNGANPICDIHGGDGKQKVSMRVCPPAEVEKSAFCGGFDRHIVGNDYFKYNGSINAQVRVWLRPAQEAALRAEFFAKSAIPIFKAGMVSAYRVDKIASGSLATPSDNELLEWYVRKNGQEQLMACRRGVVDYKVGGSNVNSNLMIDAFTNLPGQKGAVQLLSDAPCNEWLSAQEKEYAAIKALTLNGNGLKL